MCTVTFIPVGNLAFFTSSRDEQHNRLSAEPPLLHKTLGTTLLFPKDGNKGGTWICTNQNGDCGVLLNGAIKRHLPKFSYRHSRGHILPQLLASSDPLNSFSHFDAREIEPFTLVLYVKNSLYECRWDGTLKTINSLPANKPHIWSSSTLYDAEMQQKRKSWFDQWLKGNLAPDNHSVINFHLSGGEGNPSVDLKMNRNGEMLTVSVTSVQLDTDKALMTYHPINEKKTYRSEIHFSNSTMVSFTRWWQKFTIRLLHWEYWPFHIVYAPIYPYWFWLCLKARSLFFFTASNPTIRNGGFLMESKMEIYDLIPVDSYPKTLLVRKEEVNASELKDLLMRKQFSFPLIAKPDIGLRGIAVKLVRTIEELENYHQQSKVDFLVQDYVPYENEVGIFYCRMPGTSQGQITGIVGKELLSVTGDGKQSIAQLLQQEKRFLLQVEALQKSDPVMLTQVLNDNETKLLVPYGNHCRGAKFIDLTDKMNERLSRTINALCLQIPGFYFGRLDIRYNSWEEFCNGLNYAVIELNGAGSEPAHIYDPKHSIFFGWKEIIRHLNLLYQISKKNKQMKKLPYMPLKGGVSLFRENAAYMRKIS
ncbi:MAG: NRDE family protein [Bacteroidota bacterium]